MSGFKSFVDPTTLHLGCSLSGIVGPNGCGKSNIIDAVRWVMGENPRHLRGDSMEDVIFNGSSARKPVGQASIELVFDNSQGKVGGQYAHYNEISIRRQLSRDGQSKYFLNGSKCRRRDITDIFLGTGLGPRSYAIIEQGMISRLIESKPEELRVYLEEAAGISKYKERRRETENRIRHARENISRLDDLREEIDKQLGHLKRQANTAERYKVLKQEERKLRAEVLLLKLRQQEQEGASRKNALQAQETLLEKTIAEMRALETEMEKSRHEHSAASEALNEVQGQYYRLGGDISRVEQSIQHATQLRQQQQEEYAQAQQALSEAQQTLEDDQQRLAELEQSISTSEPRLEQAQAGQAQCNEALVKAEQAMSVWQAQWEALSSELAEPAQQAQVERARMEQLERNLKQHEVRETRLKDELDGMSLEQLNTGIQTLKSDLQQQQESTSRFQAAIQDSQQSIQQCRQQNQSLQRNLDETRNRAHRLRGRLASLEALQEETLQKRDEALHEWLQQTGLNESRRLVDVLEVESGWESALDMVLENYLDAVCVDGLWSLQPRLQELMSGRVTLLDMQADTQAADTRADLQPIASRLKSNNPLHGLLSSIYVCETSQEAMRHRDSLSARESIATLDGVWLGRDWLRVMRGNGEQAGMLARKSEIQSLQSQLAEVERLESDLQDQLGHGVEELHRLEQARETMQTEYNDAVREQSRIESRLQQQDRQHQYLSQRHERISEELADIRQQIDHDSEEHQQATLRRNRAAEQLQALSVQRDELAPQREAHLGSVNQAREDLRTQTDAVHSLTLSLETMRSRIESITSAMQRVREQVQQNASRAEALASALKAASEPIETMQRELQGLLDQRLAMEDSLREARSNVQDLEAAMRGRDQQRVTLEQDVETARGKLDGLRMQWQEVNVRAQTLREQLEETGEPIEVLTENLDESANLQEWSENLDKLTRRIERLGPINLAAISEFEELSKRKEHLDSQHADLIEALETLEQAIRKIDRETRTRFRETYDRVNTSMQETFPRLFGGGQAHLEMTGDDLLTTGVSILARPPGKRLSTIHLMSGGEKALTAVSLVFAIFSLNPAPFCMLDEVDAPLDEANVGRFCELVREMSENVQFIFITHNKVTMEFAERLIGVTMHEPGVSRLVTVDVDEAAQMATA